MTNAIEVRGLCKEYGDFRLDRVDLTVPCGAIVGPVSYTHLTLPTILLV